MFLCCCTHIHIHKTSLSAANHLWEWSIDRSICCLLPVERYTNKTKQKLSTYTHPRMGVCVYVACATNQPYIYPSTHNPNTLADVFLLANIYLLCIVVVSTAVAITNHPDLQLYHHQPVPTVLLFRLKHCHFGFLKVEIYINDTFAERQ